MSIEESWKDINNIEDGDFTKLLASAKLSKMQSTGTLQKIKRNLLISIYWSCLICLLYVVIIWRFPLWQVQLCMGFVLLFSLWALLSALAEYRKINFNVSPTNSVLDELKRHYKSLENWMHIQKRVALFIYPVSAAGGFMLGGYLASGKPVSVFMAKPAVLIALIIVIIILVPACHWLAKWMFKVSFGKCMDNLRQNIQELEAEK
jgi:hypothetical protein